jgi:hypothetical protein
VELYLHSRNTSSWRGAYLTLCVASQRMFIVVSVYFVIDSVRKLLDISSYNGRQQSFLLAMSDIFGHTQLLPLARNVVMHCY